MKRDRIDIIQSILFGAKEPTAKTRIQYNANLSSKQLNIYLDYLIETNLLTPNVSNKRTFYETTEKGFKFLMAYMNLQDFLNKEENPPNLVNLMVK